MITEIYTIYDSKAQIYNKPFHQHNEEVCKRTIKQMVNDAGTDIYNSPEDFSVFLLGTYDDNTGEFDLLPTPEVKIKCHELKNEIEM